jgi:hypothetical protein
MERSGVNQTFDAITRIVDCAVEAAASSVSIDVFTGHSVATQSDLTTSPSHVIAISHDGRGLTPSELRDSGLVLVSQVRSVCAELGLSVCVLSRTQVAGGTRAAAFGHACASADWDVFEWDANGTRAGDAPLPTGPFEDERELLHALERIGTFGTMVLLCDRPDGAGLHALDLSDPTDMRCRGGVLLPRIGACRSLWRVSLRERLSLMYSVSLPLALRLRGTRVVMRPQPLDRTLGRDVGKEQLSALGALHGVDDDDDESGGESWESADDEEGEERARPAQQATIVATAHGVDLDSDASSGASSDQRRRAGSTAANERALVQVVACEVVSDEQMSARELDVPNAKRQMLDRPSSDDAER